MVFPMLFNSIGASQTEKILEHFSTIKTCITREFSEIVGHLIEREKLKALKQVNGNYDAKMNMSPHLLPNFSSWLSRIGVPNNDIHNVTFAIEIFHIPFLPYSVSAKISNCHVLSRVDNTRIHSALLTDLEALGLQIWIENTRIWSYARRNK
nr:unnamed protein product [Callosobruchus analis]